MFAETVSPSNAASHLTYLSPDMQRMLMSSKISKDLHHPSILIVWDKISIPSLSLFGDEGDPPSSTFLRLIVITGGLTESRPTSLCGTLSSPKTLVTTLFVPSSFVAVGRRGLAAADEAVFASEPFCTTPRV